MRMIVPGVASVLALLLTTAPGTGQERTGLMADLIAAVAAVESKVVGLAKAMPESAYAWRPGEGVRSAGEVFIHLAGENYYAAAKFGNMTQAGTGITGAAHAETDAYEQRKMTRAQVIDAVEQSFALMKKSMIGMPDARLETMTEYARQKVTLRTAWTRTTVHIHEHLGQLIAYARTNKIVPPGASDGNPGCS
jgi:hypothetical protein